MGVKDLWSILSPSCEKKSLWELEGLNVAIDLSSWIVDSQNIGDNSVMNMYLRNLFFRTSYLLMLGVKPVFVLEGKAPELKHDTIARRQENLRGNQVKNTQKTKSGNRGRLNCLQKRCEELLQSLGVRCYKSDGEAEALCSRLNEIGVVDAVISQDSDCFLYGAQVVLRNFTMGPSYTCDMYTMENIKHKLSLGREKLLALSLLCGCDYETGVQGVGKQSALKFLATCLDDQVLDRLRSWRDNPSHDSQSVYSQMSQEDKLEHNIRKKATVDPRFPSEQVISEFLSTKSIDLPEFVWTKPSLANFMTIAERHLAWEDEYIHSKFMPLLTRWHLLNGGSVSGLVLQTIVKKRSVRSVPSYELNWLHDAVGQLTTVEPVYLVALVYHELHEAFVESKKPKKGTRGRKKKVQNNDLDNVENLFENLDISGKTKKQPVKKRAKEKNMKGIQTLEKFFIKESNVNDNHKENTTEPNILHSTPIAKPTRNVSCHYLSDDSEIMSPLHKNNKHPLNREKEELTPLSENIGKSVNLEKEKEVCTGKAEESDNLISFADFSVDSAAFDLSDIVNSIVTRTSNPALNIWTNQM